MKYKPFSPQEFLSEYKSYLLKKYGKKWDRTYLPISLLDVCCEYYMMLSSRSDGKTYSVIEMILYLKIKWGYSGGIIRRWDDDLKPKTATEIIKNFIGVNEIVYERTKGKWNNAVEEISSGVWNSIKYIGRKFYLAKIDLDGEKEPIIDDTPLMYTFAISMEEHYKMTSYPDIMITLFDEFITRNTYLEDEAISYFNIISTIVRVRDNLINFLCANTISLYCPYFNEMGITKIKKMECGDIDTYEYRDKNSNPIMHLRIEYIKSIDKKYKKSNKYFAFNNPKLRMIDEGKFELRMYPHLQDKFEKDDIKLIYFIEFDGETLQAEIVFQPDRTFTFIHRKTTPIWVENNTIIFSDKFNTNFHYRRKITKVFDEIGKKILSYYHKDLVFYQDNEVGNIVENYLNFCIGG